VENLDHWTLGIPVNAGYGTDSADWRLMHFNSILLDNRAESEQLCRDFAQFVLWRVAPLIKHYLQ
jgi:hypothetical protein